MQYSVVLVNYEGRIIAGNGRDERFDWRGGILEGGQEHRQPLRRARDGGLGLRQLARHAGLGDVRDDGGIEGGGDADEDERAEA